ncbi:hypothetical protein [Sphingosinicella sp.]|uniref:hypothetical protein n=1 Tax=Sphingosinicella sp. TaxID=1917971 RepID=UPI0017E5E49C|nr:hypothetical protein [Sphingosinicella sp.]MBA4759363.1 hypothetical protein [Sphingosinicella sp.]
MAACACLATMSWYAAISADILPLMTLEEESKRATAMLRGKTVKRIMRFRKEEVVVEFEDGSRFFADSIEPVELSITL